MKNSVYQVALLNQQHRSQSNSPALWSLVLAGSLLLNMGSVWAFQMFLQQMKPTPSVFEPVAIELVDPPISTKAMIGSTSGTETVRSSPPIANSSTRPLVNTRSSAESAIGLYNQNNDSSKVEQGLNTQGASITETASTQMEVSNSERSQPFTASGGQDSISTQLDESDRSSKESQKFTEEFNSASELQEPVTSGMALPPVPDTPDPAENVQTAQKPLGDPAAIGRLIPPTVSAHVKVNAYQLNVSESSSTEMPPDTIVEGHEASTRTFASHELLECSLTPDSLSSFGQPVRLEISLNEQGTLDDQSATNIQSSSGNESYNDLAICVLKQWRFNVASFPIRRTEKAISRRLEVDVTLTR